MLIKLSKCALAAGLVCASILASLTILLSIPTDSPAADPSPAAGSQDTRLMQQMDHRQRLDRERQKTEREGFQAGLMTGGDEATTNFDYLVIAGLTASAAGVLVVSAVRKRGRLRSARGLPPSRTVR